MPHRLTRLTAQDLSVSFGAHRPVLQGVNLAFASGELVGLVGRNGAGKSTLLKAMAGLLPLSSGAVRFGDEALDALSPTERALRIAWVGQQERLPHDLRAADYVRMGRFAHGGMWGAQGPEHDRPMRQAMEKLDVWRFRDRAVGTLSSGELATVRLARALAAEPKALLLDEPTAHLDMGHAQEVLAMLKSLSREGMAVGVVLHDLDTALSCCDRLALLHGGRLVAEGTPAEVLAPHHAAAQFGVAAEILYDSAGKPHLVAVGR